MALVVPVQLATVERTSEVKAGQLLRLDCRQLVEREATIAPEQLVAPAVEAQQELPKTRMTG